MSVDNDFELATVRGTGMRAWVTAANRIPPYDPRAGEHFWVVVTAFRVNPAGWSTGPDGTVDANLDQENLVNIAGPLCFHCERVYSALLASRRCSGSPR